MDNQERKQKIHEWLETLKSGEYNPTHVSDGPERMFITSIFQDEMLKKERTLAGLDETADKEPQRSYRVELAHLYTDATETIELRNMSGILAVLTFVNDHPDYADMYVKSVTSL